MRFSDEAADAFHKPDLQLWRCSAFNINAVMTKLCIQTAPKGLNTILILHRVVMLTVLQSVRLNSCFLRKESCKVSQSCWKQSFKVGFSGAGTVGPACLLGCLHTLADKKKYWFLCHMKSV